MHVSPFVTLSAHWSGDAVAAAMGATAVGPEGTFNVEVEGGGGGERGGL